MCCITAFAGTISLQPSATTLTLGTPLTLDVNVSGLSDLYAFQFDISFDPAMLSGTGVAEGVLFGGVGVFFSPGFIDNIGGSITFIGDSLSGPGPGISTDGTLATIIFNSIGAGSSGISLANVVLLDSNLGDISATGSGTSVSVIAGGSAVPEPATFVLLLSAIAALGAGSLFRLVPKAL
jgi:general secretion pathway protein D